MKASPAFQFYADDFIAGTCDMTRAEVGAYIRLLCYQWTRGSIPSDPKKLRMIAGGGVSEYVKKKFARTQEDDRIRNERLESERRKQASYRDKQRIKGIKSGVSRQPPPEPRLNRGSLSVRTGDEPDGQPKSNSPSPSPSPSPKGKGSSPPPLSTQNAAEIPSWEQFWAFCQLHELPAEWFARDKFLAAQQEDWAGKTNWRAYAQRCAGWWREAGCPARGTPKGSEGKPRTRPPKPHVDCHWNEEKFCWIDDPR